MANISVEREMRRAKTSERQGRPDEARSIYTAILEKFPNNLRAQQALSALTAASPQGADAANLQGDIAELVSQLQAGQFALVADRADALLGDYSSSSALWNLSGLANKALGRTDQAELAFRNILKIDPEQAQAHYNLGILLGEQGKLDDAAACYRRATAIKPDYAMAHNNLGNTLLLQGKAQEAEQSFERVLRIEPNYHKGHNNLGNALTDQGRLAEAAESFRRAVRLKPDYADAHVNLGNALRDMGHAREAGQSFATALRIAPDLAIAHNGLGNALSDLGQPDEAISSYREAIRLKPDYAIACNNLGAVLRDVGRIDEAIESYRRAIEAKPDYTTALAQKLHQQAQICDWSAFEEFERVKLTLGLEGDAATPFDLLAFEDSPERQLLRSRRYAEQIFMQQPLPMPARPRQIPDRIRIGYFSADFHDHPMLYLMAGLFREHDRSRFEIFAFSYGPQRESAMRDRVRPHFDHFIDIAEMPDDDVLRLAWSHGIDVAIDRKGYTQHSRSRLFASRLAPVQISYVAYPGSMGADFIDYIVADPVVIPEPEREFYSEEIIYLPNSYFPADNRQAVATTDTNRADFGLPESGFVFCCFNQNYKIGPREFDIWMRVLGQVEGSVLWLLRSNRWAEANLRKEAGARGIDPERLVFAERLPHPEHLARHRHANLFIDTFNYNAHTTASDALWTGLPVVTKAGRQFAARVAASLLTAVGMPELITGTEADYEALILELASNPDRLAAIKARLSENRLTQPLFDTGRYTRDFERAIETVFEQRVEAAS